VSTNWSNLRPWKNSQNSAFEELCCQLAQYEPVSVGAKFTRKGTPDAGVECFWQLRTGGEWGWQAKFLFPPFGPSQWRQLDESVYTALRTHPNLTRYTICLPFDRSDPRGKRGNRSFLDNWNERVRKWQTYARRRGHSVEFIYWGDSEIHSRLAQEAHAGRYKFWFDKEFFSPSWFAAHIREVVANAGDRYTPVLNVDLPIARIFDGLGRSPDFFSQIVDLYRKLRTRFSKLHFRSLRELAPQQTERLEQSFSELFKSLNHIHDHDWIHIPFEGLALAQIQAVQQEIDFLREKPAPLKVAEPQIQPEPAEHAFELPTGINIRDEILLLYELSDALDEVSYFADSSSALLANKPALLLVGRPGSGKTHLFCDVASRRISNGYPTVILLGEQFSAAEPWKQILELLKLNCTREEFLGALDAAALAAGTRALIFIDALNEGDGQKIWNKHLAGLLSHLENYPRIGIAVSVRSSYENAIIPDALKLQQKLIREEHHGFQEHEYEAANRFFAHFGIAPSVPLLFPEFSTPQFLLLFCKSVKNRNLSHIPTGLHGITSIFDFYLDSINHKLARPEYLDFDALDRLVQRATEQITKKMFETKHRWLAREKARETLEALLPGREYNRSLFRHLLAEGILAEDIVYSENHASSYVIRFSYERFADHYIAKLMLDTYLSVNDPKDAFLPDRPLGSLFKDNYWVNQGLIESLCVQVPERINEELPNVLPAPSKSRQFIRTAQVESFLWRARTAFNESTTKYINGELLRYKDSARQFWNVVITLAPIPGHSLNADALHKNLSRLSLADRDAWWSTFIHEQYGTQSAIDRLIDWTWSPLREHHMDRDAAVLFATALAWMLTSSNRFLRDTATKSLVRLIDVRIDVLLLLLEKFKSVNDPYVIERLCAVSYGCAMKARGRVDLSALGMFFYDWMFKARKPYPHLLVRDYARGVIEAAVSSGTTLDVSLSKVRPPYQSEWPKQIPSKEDLEAKYGWTKDGMADNEWARYSIYSSVMGFGDFARYVIGTNSGSFEWSPFRLGKRPQLSRGEKHDRFIASLKGAQLKAWKRLQSIEWRMLLEQLDARNDEAAAKSATISSTEELTADLQDAQKTFEATLSQSKLATYKRDVLSYKGHSRDDDERFDLSIAQRWILQRVFDLGWTVEKLGEFDHNVKARGRDAAKAERIGKKYQWIAYHEFLARVADHFQFANSLFSDSDKKYEGPWQLFGRDIDPSCTVRELPGTREKAAAWWCPLNIYSFDPQVPRKTWLTSKANLPPVLPFLEVVHPEDGSHWLVLESYPEWQESASIADERSDPPRKWLWYQLRSFVVQDKNATRMFKWLAEQRFWGRWMPENPDFNNIFLGEFYWVPSVSRHTGVTNANREKRSNEPKLPFPFILTSADYSAQMNSFDCSNDNFRIRMPGAWIVREMGLRGNHIEGKFFDSAGNLIAFDPAIFYAGPNALLIRKEAFSAFLRKARYEVMWFLLGGKQSLGGGFGPDEWLGELQVSGAYRLVRGKISGGMRAKAIKPKAR
jgi:hypothetical protein